MTLSVRTSVERWPIAGKFAISRGARTEAVVVVAEISDGEHRGRGECVPYARYGETVESVLAEIAAAEVGKDREALRRTMRPGAARNAVDCALWDLEAKETGVPAVRRSGLMEVAPVLTAYTLSLGAPDEMGEAARQNAARPLLKLKLGGEGDADRLKAVRTNAPQARLIVDANEAWDEGDFAENMRACAAARVELIEQPLPAGADDLLSHVERTIPICADESLHVAADLHGLAGKYEAVNIKLDKAGGLTEALHILREARARGFSVMVGCMVGTSLAMAPAFIVAQGADLVDLDGPLLLARDRDPAITYEGARMLPPPKVLWG